MPGRAFIVLLLLALVLLAVAAWLADGARWAVARSYRRRRRSQLLATAY